jgi:hypothetical protein
MPPDWPNSRFLTEATCTCEAHRRQRLERAKLEYIVRAMFSAPGRTRTYDRQIRRLLLYPLSYGGSRERTVPELYARLRITVAP